jgi:YD repeat-containing protein
MRFRRHTQNSAGQEAGGSVTTLVEDESTRYDEADEPLAFTDGGARELAMEWHAVEERILTLVAELHTLQLEAARLGVRPSWDEPSPA